MESENGETEKKAIYEIINQGSKQQIKALRKAMSCTLSLFLKNPRGGTPVFFSAILRWLDKVKSGA